MTGLTQLHANSPEEAAEEDPGTWETQMGFQMTLWAFGSEPVNGTYLSFCLSFSLPLFLSHCLYNYVFQIVKEEIHMLKVILTMYSTQNADGEKLR